MVRADQLGAVRSAIFQDAGEKTFMFTLTVDEALPESAANPLQQPEFDPGPAA